MGWPEAATVSCLLWECPLWECSLAYSKVVVVVVMYSHHMDNDGQYFQSLEGLQYGH